MKAVRDIRSGPPRSPRSNDRWSLPVRDGGYVTGALRDNLIAFAGTIT